MANWTHNSASVPAVELCKETHTELTLNVAGGQPSPTKSSLYPNTYTALLQAEKQAAYICILFFLQSHRKTVIFIKRVANEKTNSKHCTASRLCSAADLDETGVERGAPHLRRTSNDKSK